MSRALDCGLRLHQSVIVGRLNLTTSSFVPLGLLAAGLSVVIAWELRAGAEGPPAVAVSLPQDAKAEETPRSPVDLQQLSAALLGRPLFSPSRRPPVAGTAARAETPPDVPLPRLSGILVASDGRIAIFAGENRAVIVQEGGRIGRFTVRSIGPGEIVLQGPDGFRSLRPSFGPNQGGQPAAAEQRPVAPASQVPPPTGLAELRRQVSQAAAAAAQQRQ